MRRKGAHYENGREETLCHLPTLDGLLNLYRLHGKAPMPLLTDAQTATVPQKLMVAQHQVPHRLLLPKFGMVMIHQDQQHLLVEHGG